MRPAVKCLVCKNELCPRRTDGTTSVTYCLSYSSQGTDSWYILSAGQNVHRLPRTWPNKLPDTTGKYDHYKLAITLLQSSYLPTLDQITLPNVDGFYWFIFYVYVRIYFYLFIICYFIFLFILYNIEKERRRV